MFHKIFNALPEFLSAAAKTALFESEISEANGLISWPRVMKYIIYNDFRERIKLTNPPKNDVKYKIEIYNLEAYEYLQKTGWVYDPKHTGKAYVPHVDTSPTA